MQGAFVSPLYSENLFDLTSVKGKTDAKSQYAFFWCRDFYGDRYAREAYF